MAARSKRAIRQLLPLFLAAPENRVTVGELQHELGSLSYRLSTYIWNMKDRLMATFEVERASSPATEAGQKARSVIVAYRLMNPEVVKTQMERRVANGSMETPVASETPAPQPDVTEAPVTDATEILEAVTETAPEQNAAEAAVAIAEPVVETAPVAVEAATDEDPLKVPAFLDRRGKPLTGAALKAAQRKAATAE